MTATVALAAEFARLSGGGPFAQWWPAQSSCSDRSSSSMGVLVLTERVSGADLARSGLGAGAAEQTGDERWWLAFGAIAGFSLNTKYLIAFYLVAAGRGSARHAAAQVAVASLGVTGKALLAVVMLVPNLLWQQTHWLALH